MTEQDNTETTRKLRGNSVYIRIGSAYGRKLFYPACKNAESFLKLTGGKTFQTEHLQAIEGLGYKIEVKVDTNWKV